MLISQLEANKIISLYTSIYSFKKLEKKFNGCLTITVLKYVQTP